jgi:Exo-beta-D-glucosaminidase Ig-fold domain
VSTPGFDTGSWLHVMPDGAGAPGTEAKPLVQNYETQVLPVFWSDNDITLWPGESQTLPHIGARRCAGPQRW